MTDERRFRSENFHRPDEGPSDVQSEAKQRRAREANGELLWSQRDYEGREFGREAPKLPQVLSKADFLKGFIPPDYLVDGVLQRRFIYSLTGQTGHAKTAIALLIARLVACEDENVF